MNSAHELPIILERLVNAWCDRHALLPLRYLLQAYPTVWNHTDECTRLLEALKDIRGLARDSVKEDEFRDLSRAIVVLQAALAKR